jgi:hypothetical protein
MYATVRQRLANNSRTDGPEADEDLPPAFVPGALLFLALNT